MQGSQRRFTRRPAGGMHCREIRRRRRIALFCATPKPSTPFAGCMLGGCLCCRQSRASKGLAACAPRRALSQCCRLAEADSLRRNCGSRWILLGSALGQLVVPSLCRLWWRICYRARSFPDRQQAGPHRYGSAAFELEDIVWLTQQLALRRSGTRSMLIEVEIDAASRMLDGADQVDQRASTATRLLTYE